MNHNLVLHRSNWFGTMKDKKDKPYVILDNSGKVFFSKEADDMGTLTCGKCHKEKGFTEMRWSERYTANLCEECRKQVKE
jgi:hypothetical protein